MWCEYQDIWILKLLFYKKIMAENYSTPFVLILDNFSAY